MVGGRKAEDEVWFVHSPLKNEPRPIVNAPPPSNIPYLNGVMDTEEDLQRRNSVFKETDSSFIRLAKMGGRHDLLVHKNPSEKTTSKEPVGYPIPEWWLNLYQTDQEKKETKSNEPYTFQVPAWFVHKNKVEMSDLPSRIQTIPNIIPKINEKIEEPRKYGQLRNYLHPIKVTNENNQRAKPIQHYSQMGKIISNDLEKERPKDYNEWKNRHGPNQKY